ncbi:MAG: tetratricopeptide repeat protein [Treponema sp.]|nr:tetratricopeptide repeat protein [Treponema sp.]
MEFPNQTEIRKRFEVHETRRIHIVKDLAERIELILSSLSVQPTIRGRTKSFDSYYKKLLKSLKTEGEFPLITDMMGIRVICPFIEDLDVVEDLIKRNVTVIEVERKGQSTYREFGYESNHLLIKIPPDILYKWGSTDLDVAEIQIRTLLQDAWAEVEHELVYKTEFNPFDNPMKRKLAAVNASLSLADLIFQEIRTYQRQLNGELEKRRGTFFQKIEEASDAFILDSDTANSAHTISQPADAGASGHGTDSIDDLLLLALSAHNRNKFDEAIDLYSRILKLRPDPVIESIIYKHRGMANFAQSKYQDAIDDFTQAINLDKKSYKVWYFRGVVKAVQQDYSLAIDDFTDSLKINPYQPFCLFRRGQAYYHLSDYPQALADCDASLAIEPANATVIKFKEMVLGKLQM